MKDVIEKLGFKSSFRGDNHNEVFLSDIKYSNDKPISLIYNYKSKWLLVFLDEFSVRVTNDKSEYNFNPTLFAGYIETEGELRTLLKQLNVKK